MLGSKVARDAAWNLAGLGAPLIAALIAIPPIVRTLGTDRFGVLTLAWVVIGYFSLLDIGLGRALTQLVAAKTGGRDEPAPALVWPALGLLAVVGVAGALVVAAIVPALVRNTLRIPADLQAEALLSFYALVVAIPFVLVTSGLVGILSAFRRFAVLNAIRGPLGALGYLAPLAVLPFSSSLVPVAAVLAATRVAATIAYLVACVKHLPPMPAASRSLMSELRPLMRFGAWMTVSNVISPLMVYIDRFVIGATVSVAAVAYYSTPYEMVTRLLVIPGAVIGVLFPAFAESHGRDDARVRRLFGSAIGYVAAVLFPIVLVVAAYANEGLRWWLGTEFASQGAPVLGWLAVGVFVNGVAQVCFALVQGIGRPDITAKLHLIELPVYLVALWFAVRTYGIVGAALAWTGRVTLDGVLLFWFSSKAAAEPAATRKLALTLVLAIAALTTPLFVDGVVARSGAVAIIAIAFAAIIWSRSSRSATLNAAAGA